MKKAKGQQMNDNAERIKELADIIIKAKKAYYKTGNAIMTDDEYDAIESELRELDPDNDAITGVGTVDEEDETAFPKVAHEIPMGSQSKCANEGEFRKWHKLHGVTDDYLATYKLDGSSVAVYYKNGKLDKTVTRGNGKIGRDVTSNGKNFIGIPKTIDHKYGNVSVRGEVVMDVATWKEIDPASPNPRNLCAGTIAREDGENAGKLRFIAFDITCEASEHTTSISKLKTLEKLNFEVVPYKWFKADVAVDEIIKWYLEVQKERTDAAVDIHGKQIWIDGFVLSLNKIDNQTKLGESSGRPKWSTALKFPSPGAETVLNDVELGVGHTGAITPVGLVEPVAIGGTTVSRVTLNNWTYINAMDIAIGDTVKIVKGGDIIPKLTEVTNRPKTRKSIPVPTKCPVCGGGVDKGTNVDGSAGAVVRCTNLDCSAQAIGKFKRLVKKLEILEIGESIIEGMYKAGIIKTMADLFRIEDHKNAIAELMVGNGVWGEKRTKTMISEVNKKKSMTLDMFLGILGIQGLGQRRAKIIMEKDKQMEELDNWRNGHLVEKAAELGVPNLAQSIYDEIQKQSDLISDLLTVVTIEKAKEENVDGVLSGKTFVLTGTMSRGRKEIQADITAAGGIPQDRLGKDTQYLVSAEGSDSESSKAKKAKKNGTVIITEEELIEMMKG